MENQGSVVPESWLRRNVDDKHALELAALLCRNDPSPSSLRLVNCAFGDLGAEALAASLRTNTNLQELIISMEWKSDYIIARTCSHSRSEITMSR